LIACLLVGVALAHVKPMPLSDEEMQFEFMSFVRTFNKQYDAAEFFVRFNNFQEEMNLVREHNAGNHTWTAGINEFSDLTREEFWLQNTCLFNAKAFKPEVENWVSNQVGDSQDWRDKKAVTPVKNQGSCGSCWAFSTTGTLEGWNVAVGGKSLINLSEQQLVDCSGSTGNQGCNGGMPDRAMKYFAQAGGACTESDYPYTARGGACKKTCKPAVTTKGPKTGKGADTLKSALGQQPVSVCIDASSAFSRYSTGTFSGPCSSSSINHAVLAVGFQDAYWIVKNSWGTSWGQGGYIYMSRSASNVCNINNYLTWPQ
jgi:cathepsin L